MRNYLIFDAYSGDSTFKFELARYFRLNTITPNVVDSCLLASHMCSPRSVVSAVGIHIVVSPTGSYCLYPISPLVPCHKTI